jgi:carboxylesterase type B
MKSEMGSSEDSFTHGTLRCSLRGKPSASTVQFRNLKYASIPARYKDSFPDDVLRVDPDGAYDATLFGPSCPHKRGAQLLDLALIGNLSLPCGQQQGVSEKMDEFECLHINVTVPKSALSAQTSNGSNLPVYVWVHGGGLSIGSNSWPQYDLQRLVERSVEIGKPIVGVAINYRVGTLGFLANDDIGAPGNMGFKDQILAFKWIKKHIAGFGGDRNNITAAGESAGSISLSTLLCADVGNEGLFERVVIMSGETTLRKPRNKWWHQHMYQDQASYLGLCQTDTKNLETKLLNDEAEKLAQQLPLAQNFCGYVDGSWLEAGVTLETLADAEQVAHKPVWCKEFVVGDTAHDGTIYKARILDHPQVLDRLKAACGKYLSDAETERLLTAYEVDTSDSPEQKENALRVLVSELRFYLPTRTVYKGWRSTSPPRLASKYHFHISNPFEGSWKDMSSHELDVTYLLQNFNDLLDEKNRKIAEEMADHFIKYANGEGWAREGKSIVFSGDGIIEVDEAVYDELYRCGRGEILEDIGMNRLWNVAEMWQGVRSEDEEVSSVPKTF